MDATKKAFWIFSGVFLIILAFLYSVKAILLPFVAALAFAYFLDPMVDKLEKIKIPRAFGTLLSIAFLVLVITVISFTVIPVFYKQIVLLVAKIAEHKDGLGKIMTSVLHWFDDIPKEIVDKIKVTVENFSGQILAFSGKMLGKVLHSGAVAVNVLSLIFITPIVMFYILRDWDIMVEGIKKLVPKKQRKASNELFADMDKALSGFIRGQSLVCLILGTYYVIGFSVLGLDSAIALGIITGMLVFIPYVGAIFASVLCILVTAMQFGDLSPVLAVLTMFIVGQTAESTFISPAIIGNTVGLHPVWIMFGLLAGGTLFGFVGVLVAVPLTAIAGVVIRFALTRYKKSALYK